MNRNQLLVVIGVVLALAAIAIAAWVAITYFAAPPQDLGPREDSSPSDPFGSITVPGAVSSSATLRLTGTDGSVHTVPDFTKGKEPIEFNGESYYFLYGPEYSTEGFTFSLQYQASDSSFLVELLAEPLGDARADAAKYLSELLRLDEKELCTVFVKVVVNDSVSATYAGYENLGLPGCEESVTLP